MAGYSCGLCWGEGREGGRMGDREVNSRGVKIDCLCRKPISPGTNHQYYIMILSENDKTSKLKIFFCFAKHFLPSRTTVIDNLPVRLPRPY